jgi:hypothetical protein
MDSPCRDCLNRSRPVMGGDAADYRFCCPYNTLLAMKALETSTGLSAPFVRSLKISA